VKYAFIEEQRAHHSVHRMCHLLEVSKSGFYEWCDRPLSPRAAANKTLANHILRIHVESKERYGRPRIHAELRAEGFAVNEKRVGKLMKARGIEGIRPRRFRKTTDSAHDLPIAANLLERKFDVAEIRQPNRVWAGDITYLPTREGWLYLAVVIDLASRLVVGWSMKTTMDRSLVIDAMRDAIRRRRATSGTIFHSDRGSQYASEEFRDLLETCGLKPSMSRKGDCWDNACVESFFGSMKRELGDPIWESRVIAQAAIFEYIEIWYNRIRRHSTLDYKSPEEYDSSLPIAA